MLCNTSFRPRPRESADGAGKYQAEWNGGPVHSFAGVEAFYVLTKQATNNQVTIELDDPPAASPAAAISRGSRTEAVTAKDGAHPLIRGTAVQNGTELTVTVSKPVSNTVIILDEGGGTLKVESDDGSAHIFKGVTTIQVQAERAKRDRIIFYTPSM